MNSPIWPPMSPRTREMSGYVQGETSNNGAWKQCHFDFSISEREEGRGGGGGESQKCSTRPRTSHPTHPAVLPLQEHQIIKLCSARFTTSKRKPQSAKAWTHNVRCARGRGVWVRWERRFPSSTAPFFPSEKKKEPENARESYPEALQFHRPSSAQSSHNSELQRRCPWPICFLCRENGRESTPPTTTKQRLLRELSLIFVSWKLDDGVPGPALQQHNNTPSRTSTEERERDLKNWECHQTTLTQYIAPFCWISWPDI